MPDLTPTIASADPQRRWNRYSVFIALDPGAVTGCAIYRVHRSGEPPIECRSLSFWDAAALADEFDPAETAVLIEDPGLNPPTFDHSEHGRRKREKISQNVGQNKQDAARLIERFRAAGFHTEAVRPLGSKWDAVLCAQLTGYDGHPNNQHVRDALRLLFFQGVI